MQNYLMIQNNIVTNVCVWDGNTESWTPPADSIMLIQSTTPAMNWFWNAEIKDYVLKKEIGNADISFVWNGTECITNEPKPTPPTPVTDQPATFGTQIV